MSIRVMAKIWKSSQARGGELLVLLAIADFADDDGIAYPSVSTLGKKARLSERQVQRAIRRLTALGELAVETGKGPHGCHLYRVTDCQVSDCQGDKLSGVTSMTQGGDISGRRGVTSMSPNPLKRTVIEPSIPPTPQIFHPVDAVEHEFVEFWGIYPMRNGKRLDKPKALKKWKGLSAEDRKQVLVAVQHYASSQMVLKGFGIKDPHRWLRDGKDNQPWKDWLDPEQQQEGKGLHNEKVKLPRSGFADRNYREGVF